MAESINIAYLREFCASNNLDFSIVSGARMAPLGRSRLPRPDTYAIELGGRHNPMSALDPQGHAPVSTAGFNGRISAVRLSHAKRFANSILQLSHALQAAQSLGAQRLHLPHLWFLTPGRLRTADGVEIIHPPAEAAAADLCHDDLVLTGGFLRMVALRPLHRRCLPPRRPLRVFRPLLRLDLQGPPDHPDDLTIHLRSGDVFCDQPPHPLYGQPPLAFYQRVVAAHPWRRVSLVFEDRLNPVIPALLEWLPGRCAEVAVVNGSLEADLHHLLRARNLVSGRGTFCCAVAALSRRLQRVYSFDQPFPTWGNRRITTFTCPDRLGHYVASVCRDNWIHSPEQRQLMLTYPLEAIDPPRSRDAVTTLP